MTRKLGLLSLFVCLTSMSAFGQTLQAVVGVTTSSTTVCEDIQNSATTTTASVSGPACSWSDATGDSGSGSGTATAAYGVLQSSANVSETNSNASDVTDTGTQTGGSFTDTLTFPALATDAILQATLSVSVTDTVSGSGEVTISADVLLNDGVSQCVLQVVKGACTTSLPVTPGSQVAIQGSFLAEASAGPTSGSSTLTADSKKTFGARFTFVLVDAAGHKLNVPLIAASGTKYPTK